MIETTGSGTAAAEVRRQGRRRSSRVLLDDRRSRIAGIVVVAAALALCCFASLAFGSVETDPSSVIDAFTSFDGTEEQLIIREIRLPRTLIGLAVGAALALAGALMQAVTRNPLADPGILGIEAGSAFVVVLAVYFLDVTAVSEYVWFAFGGAAVTALAVYTLGSVGREGATPVKLALGGAVVAALLGSLTSAVLVLSVDTLDAVRFWLVGSLAGRDLDVFYDVAPFIACGVVFALLTGRALNTLSLGDEVARTLGQRVALVRVFAALAVVLLVGGSVAAAGPIAFVGLVVPQAARMLVGPDWRWILLYSTLLGPLLLVSADVLGRVVVRPGEIEVGIMTALVGAPVFIALARRRSLTEL